MDFAFPWPFSQGEWLAWLSAVVTILLGLIAMFAPRLRLRALRLRDIEEHPEALAESRAQLGGFYIGVGVTAILFAQPLIYMALGLGWGLAVFGRIISMLSDKAISLRNWMHLVISLLLAGFPLAYAFGIFP